IGISLYIMSNMYFRKYYLCPWTRSSYRSSLRNHGLNSFISWLHRRYRDDGAPIVPIVPSVARWEKNGGHCSRKHFPLRLAYAISIHKSQGMTLRKVVIELGLLEFCRCLSFVAISRAKAITDIAFLNRI